MVYSFLINARNWTSLGVIHYFWFFLCRVAASSNKGFQPTTIPLRPKAAGELEVRRNKKMIFWIGY